MNSNISERICYLRTKHNLTLEEVANRVGVTKSTVHKWETGYIANMRRDKIEKLAAALHTSPAFLLCWTDQDTPILIQSSIENSGARSYLRNLKLEREKRGLDCNTVSQAVGISEADYVSIENGTSIPGLDVATNLSIYFCCDLDYLNGIDGTLETAAATLPDDSRAKQFADLFSRLSDDQQNMILLAIKGLLSEE